MNHMDIKIGRQINLLSVPERELWGWWWADHAGITYVVSMLDQDWLCSPSDIQGFETTKETVLEVVSLRVQYVMHLSMFSPLPGLLRGLTFRKIKFSTHRGN